MTDNSPVTLVTGAAHRLGAATVRQLHDRGHRVLIHCHNHHEWADHLATALNDKRPESAMVLQADLSRLDQVESLAEDAVEHWNRLDHLVNNAAVFSPHPLADCSGDTWDRFMNLNARAPLFLVKHLQAELRLQHGSVVNLIDIYAERPLRDHPVYCASKAALASLTRSLARDLAPDVRVNGVSPGAILWPEESEPLSEDDKRGLIDKVALHRPGEATDIAGAVGWLLCDAPYVTGQILSVDGGRLLNI